MKRKFAELVRIESDRPVTFEADLEFIHLLQAGLLISLRDQGYLNDSQLQHALNLINCTGELS